MYTISILLKKTRIIERWHLIGRTCVGGEKVQNFIKVWLTFRIIFLTILCSTFLCNHYPMFC